MRLIPTLALIVNGNNGSATLGHRADATRLVPHRGTDAKDTPTFVIPTARQQMNRSRRLLLKMRSSGHRSPEGVRSSRDSNSRKEVQHRNCQR